MTKHNTRIGMRRLFSRVYTVGKGKVKLSANKLPSGTVTINSQYLKGFVGKKARVFVYVQISNKKK